MRAFIPLGMGTLSVVTVGGICGGRLCLALLDSVSLELMVFLLLLLFREFLALLFWIKPRLDASLPSR